MASHTEIRELCLTFPEAIESDNGFGFHVIVKGKAKGFCWTWLDRPDPKKARVPNPSVLAIRVPNLETKDFLLNSQHPAIFTEPHYNGYPAILVRLEQIEMADLADHLLEAYNCTINPKKKK